MKSTGEAGDMRMIQWHDAFVAAMKLELKDYADRIEFHPEYELTKRPKYIDLLLINSDEVMPDEADANGIIRLFSRHNVIEYKGVGDVLNFNTLANGIAYTCMCKMENVGSGSHVRDFGDMTLTFVREAKPVKLFRDLEGMNCRVDKISDGIYGINAVSLFRVYVIVTREIGFDKYPWLSSLTRKLDERQAAALVELESNALTAWEHDNAEEVMNVAIAANRAVFERIQGGGNMCKAMWDLMKPQIDAYVAEKDKTIAQSAKKLEQNAKKLAQKDRKLAEQEREIERLNKIIAELSAG